MNKKLLCFMLISVFMMALVVEAQTNQKAKKQKNSKLESTKKALQEKAKQLRQRESKISFKTKQTIKQSRANAKVMVVRSEQKNGMAKPNGKK